MQLSDLFEFLKITGPSIVTVVGWYIVNKLTAGREIRTERRKRGLDRCDKLVEECIKVRDLAIKYHCENRNLVTERDLLFAFGEVGRALPTLYVFPVGKETVDLCIAKLITFKRATQSNHFEDAHKSPLPAGDNLLFEIAISASNLILALRKCQADLLNSV